MSFTKTYYILFQEINGEKLYLTDHCIFDTDIYKAFKINNIASAQIVKDYFCEKYKRELDIIPLKITYEW